MEVIRKSRGTGLRCVGCVIRRYDFYLGRAIDASAGGLYHDVQVWSNSLCTVEAAAAHAVISCLRTAVT